MTARRMVAVAACVLSAVAVLAAVAVEVKVTPNVYDGKVSARLVATDLWTPGLREQLQTGTPVTFDYQAELRRAAFLWPDAVLARTSITSAAKLDTLIGGYTVTRQRNGSIVRVESVSQESEVRDWLTIIESVPFDPDSPLKVNSEYYLDVRLIITPRKDVSLWSILPGGGHDASGRAEFVFIR